MEPVLKYIVSEKLGKYGAFSFKGGHTHNTLAYLNGIEYIDRLVASKEGSTHMGICKLTSRPNGVELEVLKGFNSYDCFALPFTEIQSWSIIKQERFTTSESKSVIGRALIGGLLLGPVGAVVGGLSGTGEKKTSQALNGIQNILAIALLDGTIISFSFKDSSMIIVEDFLAKTMPDKEEKV
jgi:hypothetical protein